MGLALVCQRVVKVSHTKIPIKEREKDMRCFNTWQKLEMRKLIGRFYTSDTLLTEEKKNILIKVSTHDLTCKFLQMTKAFEHR